MQRKLKLKFNIFLQAYDVNFAENSKNITFLNDFKMLQYYYFYMAVSVVIFFYETLLSKKTDFGFMEY